MKQQSRQRKSGFFVDLLIKIHNLVSMKLTDLFSTVKARLEFQANYHSVFFNGKTLRMPINPDKEVTELMWPEFYDVSFGTKCSGKCPYCFLEDALVTTENGVSLIKDIGIGDSVFTINEESGAQEVHNVSQLHRRQYTGQIFHIELENGKIIKCTPNHKIMTTNRGWVKAEDLVETDILKDF